MKGTWLTQKRVVPNEIALPNELLSKFENQVIYLLYQAQVSIYPVTEPESRNSYGTRLI